MPNDGTINGKFPFVRLDGSRDMTGYQKLAGSSPSDDLHAASKGYVDATATAAAQGLDVKGSCRAATTGALAAHSRVGNVLTASANGALAAQDGVTLVATNRLLVKGEGAGTHLENGLYTVTQVGTAGTPWILTRTTDADTSAEVTTGLYTFIEEGATLAGTAWVLRTANPITLNTTALNFAQFGASASFTTGMIMMWSGTIATIPAGWALCNGSNGTPDLTNKFVVCADADSGGAAKSTIVGAAAQSGGDTQHNHSTSGQDVQAGTGQEVAAAVVTATVVPPFYALAYIMKL